jgi:hypothetical protein
VGGAYFSLPDPYPLQFTMLPEPLSGMTTLAYILPTTVILGDIWLHEPGQPAGVFSDLIRFGNSPNPSYSAVYFFSDRTADETGPFDLADVLQMPLPDPNSSSHIIEEVGPEGNNGALYAPATISDPGLSFQVAGGAGVFSTILSAMCLNRRALLCWASLGWRCCSANAANP